MSINTIDILPIANEPATGSLREHLITALGQVSPSEIRIATAYLTPNGFMELKGQMEGVASVRLLLGERPFLNRSGPRDVLARPSGESGLQGPAESVDWYTFLDGGYPWLLLTHEERRKLLERGESPQVGAFDLSAWDRVTNLIRFLDKEGVEIRRFLGSETGMVLPERVLDHRSPSNRLHAKAYLFSGEASRYAAVGSSNLTKSGLLQNSELNLASYDRELVAHLEGWFDEKWELGQDCKQQFIHQLEECVLFGRRFTPWQVMLKSLHAAYGRFLEMGLSEEVMRRLAGFQQQAVQRCVALLNRHWGVLLCDSVGLGKTYEGLGILREFANRRNDDPQRPSSSTRALIVCPAQLQDNWNADRLVEWGITATTVTMESLPSLADIEEESSEVQQLQLYDLLKRYQDNYDIILVDESHNFRNPRTKRYKALMEIIRGGKPDKRIILMTATPINNSVWDLYYQLMLITRGDDTWYAGRGPISNLKTAFQDIEKGESGSGLLDTMLLSLVRRTRHDIRAMQDSGEPMEVGGQPLSFPKHEIPKAVNYSLQGLYGNIYIDIIDAIEHLKFAVYRLDEYGVETGELETSAQLRQRNANFVGIMRTILLKRMESSLAALTSTVSSLVPFQFNSIGYTCLSLLRASPGRGRGQALGGEPPVYDGGGLVALAFERRDLPSQQHFIAGPAVQTLPAEDAQLDLGHVQPASVIGCVVKLQAFGYAAHLGRSKCLVERAQLVGVEIVQHQPDHCGVRIGLVHQPFHPVREVHGSPALGHLDVPPPTLRFTEHEQVPGPVSLVLGVIALHPSGLGFDRRPHVPEQLLGGLVETHHRTLPVVLFVIKSLPRTGYGVQHILHPGDELPAHLGNAPLFLLPRLEFVFLSIWRTVSREMLPANSSSTTLSASR